MTSPTTNTVTDDDLRDILAEEQTRFGYPDNIVEKTKGFDFGTRDPYGAEVAIALSAMRRVAALSTHPHTGTEDRATAREVREALNNLTNNVAGCIVLNEPGVRELWGHTNVACIFSAIERADNALKAQAASERLPHPHTGGREAPDEN